jgi:hypothetical protein
MSVGMSDHVATVDELFARFGGSAAVARAIGKGPSTASEMKRRNSIPVEYWPALIESETGRQIGLRSDDLMRVNLAGRSEAAA